VRFAARFNKNIAEICSNGSKAAFRNACL